MLPRTKIQLQNGWRQWFEAYAIGAGWSLNMKAANYLDIAREVDWMLVNNNLEEDLGRRKAKIDAFISAAIDPATFDPFYVTRYAFLSWLST